MLVFHSKKQTLFATRLKKSVVPFSINNRKFFGEKFSRFEFTFRSTFLIQNDFLFQLFGATAFLFFGNFLADLSHTFL
ncbi:hypothetical protein VV86_22575 [Vibrio vulnificus]|nr:hypothetical protein CRN53_08985 [Vibrio vulnificus]PWY29686.1 hypothetical protein VV86_22575 [Vibrio vulnificus]